jgi:hypothetical protein
MRFAAALRANRAWRSRALIAHDLFRKPVAIPDRAEDMLFGIMRPSI